MIAVIIVAQCNHLHQFTLMLDKLYLKRDMIGKVRYFKRRTGSGARIVATNFVFFPFELGRTICGS